MDLDELQRIAVRKWGVFDGTKYPVLDELSENQKDIFALRHITTHFLKNVGALAAVVESMDHGAALDKTGATQALRKVLINALQYAHHAGISVHELENEVTEWEKQT